ncbi:hypothetical protein BJV74DRAFT_808832 [Russula compacta]|nr:hypothetical protein BJV74DRAFT_808832 [Russula compacta]
MKGRPCVFRLPAIHLRHCLGHFRCPMLSFKMPRLSLNLRPLWPPGTFYVRYDSLSAFLKYMLLHTSPSFQLPPFLSYFAVHLPSICPRPTDALYMHSQALWSMGIGSPASHHTITQPWTGVDMGPIRIDRTIFPSCLNWRSITCRCPHFPNHLPTARARRCAHYHALLKLHPPRRRTR